MIDICCDELGKEIEKGDLLEVLDNIPFSPEPTESTLYLISDGGHGGFSKASFCPFCGTKVRRA